MDGQSFQHNFFKKWFFSPLNCFCTFVKNQLVIFVWVYFWTLFCSIDLCVLLHQYSHCLDNCTFIIRLKIKSCDYSNFILLFQNFNNQFSIIFCYESNTMRSTWLELCHLIFTTNLWGCMLVQVCQEADVKVDLEVP